MGGEEKPELSAEDMIPMIKEALLKGGFDSASEEQAVVNAKTSGCRMLSPRKCMKLDPLCKITKEAHDTTIEKFSELVTARMADKDVRIQGNAIYVACEQLKIIAEGDEPSYCDQMCTKMSQSGAEISDGSVGQTAGESSAELQAKVDSLIEMLKQYTTQESKCREGSEALKAFKMTLAPLEKAIQTTFDAWFKANRDLDEAEEVLEELMDEIEDSAESFHKMEAQLKAATENLDEAKAALTRVKASELFLKGRMKIAKKKLAEAKKEMEKNNDALKAAELIKEKVGGIIERLTGLYDFFVKEPIRNMMLDDPETLAVFDAISPEEKGASDAFQESMTSLSVHCKEEALPAFSKISSIDLTPLCNFGDGAAQSVVSMVATRKKGEVKDELDKFKSWWKDFEVSVDETNEVTQPVLLDEVMEAFPEPTFSSEYMVKWKTEGPFLSAIEKLRMTIRDLNSEVEGVEEKIKGMGDAYKNNIELRKQARSEIKAALKDQELAEEDVQKAADLLEAQEAEMKEQDSNVERLRKIARAALEEYRAALKAFDDVFIAGTKLDLLQKNEESNLPRGGSKLKPVKRVL